MSTRASPCHCFLFSLFLFRAFGWMFGGRGWVEEGLYWTKFNSSFSSLAATWWSAVSRELFFLSFFENGGSRFRIARESERFWSVSFHIRLRTWVRKELYLGIFTHRAHNWLPPRLIRIIDSDCCCWYDSPHWMLCQNNLVYNIFSLRNTSSNHRCHQSKNRCKPSCCKCFAMPGS